MASLWVCRLGEHSVGVVHEVDDLGAAFTQDGRGAAGVVQLLSAQLGVAFVDGLGEAGDAVDGGAQLRGVSCRVWVSVRRESESWSVSGR